MKSAESVGPLVGIGDVETEETSIETEEVTTEHPLHVLKGVPRRGA